MPQKPEKETFVLPKAPESEAEAEKITQVAWVLSTDAQQNQ
jgi:hypothetical protein